MIAYTYVEAVNVNLVSGSAVLPLLLALNFRLLPSISMMMTMVVMMIPLSSISFFHRSSFAVCVYDYGWICGCGVGSLPLDLLYLSVSNQCLFWVNRAANAAYTSFLFYDAYATELLIHRAPFVNPWITKTCSHTFCLNCIQKALETKLQCPVDRTPLNVDDLRPAHSIIRNVRSSALRGRK